MQQSRNRVKPKGSVAENIRSKVKKGSRKIGHKGNSSIAERTGSKVKKGSRKVG